MKYILIVLIALSCHVAIAQRDVPPTKSFSIYLQGKKEPVAFDIAAIKKMKQDNLGNISIKNHRGEEKYAVKAATGVLLKSFFDVAKITTEKPKQLSELYVVLVASDGYRNVYSWNEIFNTEVGNHIYVITSMDGKGMDEMNGAITVLSLGDMNGGARHLRGLEKIEVRKVE